jgi:branched-subunit amino acid transport protein AzlD
MSLHDAVIATIVIAVVTLFTRAFPFIFFMKKNPPESVRFIQKYIPPMVMLILVVYCFKDVVWTMYPHGIPMILSSILVAVLHLWKGNSLISIFGGTIFYMVIVHVMK